MLTREQFLAKTLHRFRLDSVRRKMLVLSVLATLIPSVTIGSIFYLNANRFLTDKVAEQLRDLTAQNARELDLWLKERLYEVRVFSSSYEVSENLEALTRGGGAAGDNTLAFHRLTDYLRSVRGRFGDYEELAVVNPKTQTVATSAARAGSLTFPSDWQARARADAPIVGQAYRDQALDKMVMLIAVPIRGQNGRLLGMLAAKLNFHAVKEILDRSVVSNTGAAYLIQPDGGVITGSGQPSATIADAKQILDAEAQRDEEPVLLRYRDAADHEVIGVLRRLSQLDWGVVAQIGTAEVYAQTVRIRFQTMAIGVGLLLAIGLAAYLLGLTIVRPLNRLTDGAAKVAAGDLAVKLPVIGHGEVGYLTEAFNEMVERLRQSQEQLATINQSLSARNEELQTVSITDSLTGLHNRKHFMELLAIEVARAGRSQQRFAVAMIDADHFKGYNDTLGHQAGDALLKGIATILRSSLRSVDHASRYGGDEFLVLLPDVGVEGALEVAERIREQVAAARYSGDPALEPVTVSIGVATFSEHGEAPEALIASADSALYHAKRSGRNRVVAASSDRSSNLEVAS